MSDSGDNKEQKPFTNWALNLQNSSNICDHQLSQALFDDEPYGIRIFCHPYSLIYQSLQPEVTPLQDLKNSFPITKPLYADAA